MIWANFLRIQTLSFLRILTTNRNREQSSGVIYLVVSQAEENRDQCVALFPSSNLEIRDGCDHDTGRVFTRSQCSYLRPHVDCQGHAHAHLPSSSLFNPHSLTHLPLPVRKCRQEEESGEVNCLWDLLTKRNLSVCR